MLKVVIADGFGDSRVEEQVLAGVDVRLVEAGLKPGMPFPEELLDADVILTVAFPINASLLQKLPSLKLIGRYGAGVDNIDLNAARRRHVAVTNVPDANFEEVATHALALLLACARGLVDCAGPGDWANHRRVAPLMRLSEATLGVIGTGRAGRSLIRQASSIFGKIVYLDPYAEPEYPELQKAERFTGVEGLLEAAHFVSLHCPLTAETRGLINTRSLEAARPGTVLVNTARGGLVEEKALLAALETGRVALAGLDVLNEEPPPPDHPLIVHPRVLYTPHLAWYSESSLRETRQKAAEEVRRLAQDLLLLNRIT